MVNWSWIWSSWSLIRTITFALVFTVMTLIIVSLIVINTNMIFIYITIINLGVKLVPSLQMQLASFPDPHGFSSLIIVI